MPFAAKCISLIMTIILALTASACSKTNDENSQKKIQLNNLEFNDVMIIENKDTKSNIFRVKNNSLEKANSLQNVSEIVYNKDVSIYTLLIHDEDELKRNSINVLKDKEAWNINGFYYARDLRLSQNSASLAYRSYSTQSLDSAEGLSLYSIEKGKKIELKSNVLVSGNLYHWANKDEILYYGVHNEDKIAAIYKYNIQSNVEEIYTKSPKGYYTYFLPYGNNILILSRDENNNTLYLFDKEKDKAIEVSDSIEEIYDGIYNAVNNTIYFIGVEKNNGVSALYSVNLSSNKVERITYDFPSEVDPYGGLKIDGEGVVYYCGYTELQGLNNDVFKYNPKDNSNTLISINSSRYRVIGEK